ncbi:TaqI-like C-terminal specificity domain-containing protein [Helicobacter sp. 23-1044]
MAIIKKAKAQGKYSLSASIWALGIVTGDNKNALHKEQILGSEAIFTGKEIVPYRLQKAQNFIIYDRAKFQQVAKDEMYRASEKLVYKFISNKLVFAYNNSGALFLNSANILIPKIPNMSIKTALGFLNSELFAYLHTIMFGEIKILRGNLEQLPFPQITRSQDSKIASLVGKIIDGDNVCEMELQAKIYEIFGITDREQIYIKGVLNGKT